MMFFDKKKLEYMTGRNDKAKIASQQSANKSTEREILSSPPKEQGQTKASKKRPLEQVAATDSHEQSIAKVGSKRLRRTREIEEEKRDEPKQDLAADQELMQDDKFVDAAATMSPMSSPKTKETQ